VGSKVGSLSHLAHKPGRCLKLPAGVDNLIVILLAAGEGRTTQLLVHCLSLTQKFSILATCPCFASEPLKHHPSLHDFRPRKPEAELAHPNVTPTKYVLEKDRIQKSISTEKFEGVSTK
jgi:hypothetical protein